VTEREAFKLGFLYRCAEEGLTAAEAADRAGLLVKAAQGLGLPARLGGAAAELPGRALSAFGPTLAGAALLAAIGLPVLAGGAGGHFLARAIDDDTTVDEARADELVAEYRRLTDAARRQAVRPGVA
jgi:hypothetical protein